MPKFPFFGNHRNLNLDRFNLSNSIFYEAAILNIPRVVQDLGRKRK